MKEKEKLYLSLRQQVLDCTPDIFQKPIPTVYAALIDMDTGQETASLACIIDGTTSLYYSNGGGMIGIGHRHEAVKNAAISLLCSAEQVLGCMASAKSFSLPESGRHCAYLITKQGIFKHEYDTNQISAESNEMQFLFFLYQQVLTAVRESMDE